MLHVLLPRRAAHGSAGPLRAAHVLVNGTAGSSLLVAPGIRYFATSQPVFGGVRSKRKKQGLRADNPHLDIRASEKTSKIVALENFDRYYSQFYGAAWSSIRLGLLSRQKHCAVVNNFGEGAETVDQLKELGCLDITAKFNQINRQRLQQVEKLERSRLREETVTKDETSEPKDHDNDDRQHPLSNGRDKEGGVVDEEEDLIERLSLRSELAHGRYIDPEEKVIGNMSTSMYDFVPTTSLKGMEDFVEESDYYSYYKTGDKHQINTETFRSFNIPSHLRLFVFPRNVMDRFPQPRPGFSGNLNYHCIDAGAILNVLALDLMPDHVVLDMCAGAGNEALLALQTLYPKKLVCNDISLDKIRRSMTLIDQFCGGNPSADDFRDSVKYSRHDATTLCDYGVYDRVLCSVPSYSDRRAAGEDDNNIFAGQLTRARLEMPEKQRDLLKAGLMYLKPGGSLVYSTSTLSPIQNEGVVTMALKELWEEEATAAFVVEDLTSALRPFKFLCRILGANEGVRLGNQVVPHLSNNFGPAYICKITRKA